MPIQLSGQPLTLERTYAWITKDKLSFAPSGALEFFLQNCDIKYDAYQQEQFLKDFQAILTPHVEVDESTGLAFSRPSVETARAEYQTQLLTNTLRSWNAGAADGRVRIQFPIDSSNTMRVPQNNAAYSQSGDINLYTDGFEGCTALLFTPITPGTKGGLLAHVAQTGNGGQPMKDYLLKVIDEILNTASTRSGWINKGCDLTILVGFHAGTGIEVPDLAAEVKAKYAKGGIRYVQDLRPFRDRSTKFYYQSESKVLQLLWQTPADDVWVGMEEFFEGVRDSKKTPTGRACEMVQLKFNEKHKGLSFYFLG